MHACVCFREEPVGLSILLQFCRGLEPGFTPSSQDICLKATEVPEDTGESALHSAALFSGSDLSAHLWVLVLFWLSRFSARIVVLNLSKPTTL